MKKCLSLILVLLLLPALSLAEAPSLTPAQNQAFEAVKWNMDFPKDAQVVQAFEYLCKAEGHSLRLLLMEVTQNPQIESLMGQSSRLLLKDLQTDTVITYSNILWPESSQIASYEDALHMIFSCFDSYLSGYHPHLYADHEMIFPLTDEDLEAVNAALRAHFLK